MKKLSFQDLYNLFQSPRTDHPGRKGNMYFTKGNGRLSKDGRSPEERQKKDKKD